MGVWAFWRGRADPDPAARAERELSRVVSPFRLPPLLLALAVWALHTVIVGL